MTPLAHRRSYENLIERLPELAANARLTFGGFSVCVDVYLALHEVIGTLRAAAPPHSPAALMLDELVRRARCGIGGELAFDWPEGPAWMDRYVTGRHAVGGTNLQAAHMLAMLGAPAMSSLEDRSAGQLDVIHPDVLVAEHGEAVPRSSIVPAGAGRPAHYIFEYTAGEIVEQQVVPRSSRTILRFDHSELQHDGKFDRLSVELAGTAGAAIICGFNEAPPDKVPDEIDYAAGLARAWRRGGLALVHLEFGDFAGEAPRQLTIERMLPEVTSVGMSLSELRGIVPDVTEPAAAAIRLAETHGLSRVCVHADEWALAVTHNDAERELEALEAGCLLASARAAAGDFTVPRRLPDGARFVQPPLPLISRGSGDWSVVCCPAPYLERPKATIGLGDTFLAGTLLVLGGAAAVPRREPIVQWRHP